MTQSRKPKGAPASTGGQFTGRVYRAQAVEILIREKQSLAITNPELANELVDSLNDGVKAEHITAGSEK